MPQQINFGASQPSMSNSTDPEKTAYTVVEKSYETNNAHNVKPLEPYTIFARDQDRALAVTLLDHQKHEGYLQSTRDGSTLISEYEDGSKRVVVVTEGDFAPDGLEDIIS